MALRLHNGPKGKSLRWEISASIVSGPIWKLRTIIRSGRSLHNGAHVPFLTHFWRKSTVRISMVIFCFSFSPTAKQENFFLWCFCVAWICAALSDPFVSPNDGRRCRFFFCERKWTRNEFKSDKFFSRLCHLCLILQSNMIYGINSNSFFHSPRLWTSSFFGADHKVDQTMDHRNTHRLTIFDGYDAQKTILMNIFVSCGFLVNEIRFSFGPRLRR